MTFATDFHTSMQKQKKHIHIHDVVVVRSKKLISLGRQNRENITFMHDDRGGAASLSIFLFFFVKNFHHQLVYTILLPPPHTHPPTHTTKSGIKR